MTDRRCHRGRVRGFTLIESVMSILVVSVMFTAALAVVASSRVGQRITADHSRGTLLAEQLMNEILERAYIDPDGAGLTLAREAGEDAQNRTTWDDVDDYEEWSSAPPRDETGVVMSGLTGWARSVVVEYVRDDDVVSKVVGSNTGVKRITVTVTRDGRRVAWLQALRTGAKDASIRPLDQGAMVAE